MLQESVPHTQQAPNEAEARMRVIAAAAALAHPFREVVPTSRLWYGEAHTPFDIAFSTSQSPQGFGWEMTITRQEWGRQAMPMCNLSEAPGSAMVEATWHSEAGPYLATLAYALDMLLLTLQRKAAA